MEAIKRANILQGVYVISLIINQTLVALGNYSIEVFSFSPTAAQVVFITGKTFEIGFVCLLSFSMLGINKRLALFFKQVGMRSYLKRSIAAFVTVYFLFVINWDVVTILWDYITIDQNYMYLSGWLNVIIYYLVYLAVTGVFYFLADFGFEARNIQLGPIRRQKILDMHFNLNYESNSIK